ncbi:hypothetical protein SAY87_007027 [Trapa incisa]|uniref:Protein EARLY FLOWERING 4 domain-containing protein n=1 Tax=Trapa incisa TaxID=236973 RepID=A0AAN7JXT7_9MYRT|nr:hypothetical protein SAY87_007027 [Trapa incisa]
MCVVSSLRESLSARTASHSLYLCHPLQRNVPDFQGTSDEKKIKDQFFFVKYHVAEEGSLRSECSCSSLRLARVPELLLEVFPKLLLVFIQQLNRRIIIIIRRRRRTRGRSMEGDTFSHGGGGGAAAAQMDGKIMQTFQKSFVQVQHILDQNRLLINEINQNHESRVPDSLTRNVGLIRELNNNIRKVVDLYADLSSSFTKSMEASSSEGDSNSNRPDGKPAGHKRIRPV